MGIVFHEVLLGQPKVDHINFARLFSIAYNKVIWFDVSMDKELVMDKLDPFYHLIAYHQRGFQIELLPS